MTDWQLLSNLSLIIASQIPFYDNEKFWIHIINPHALNTWGSEYIPDLPIWAKKALMITYVERENHKDNCDPPHGACLPQLGDIGSVGTLLQGTAMLDVFHFLFSWDTARPAASLRLIKTIKTINTGNF